MKIKIIVQKKYAKNHFQLKKLIRKLICVYIALFFSVTIVNAQTNRDIKRYEIDAKRVDVGYTSKDALPRGREFKRLDSTYYVGWMYEGGYKFEHAADYLGYKYAANELERALILLEKDYKKQVSTRTTDVMEYLQIMKYHRDWDFIAYALINCYSNIDQANQLWSVLQRCKKMNLQDEQYLETYNSMSWTVHRNRFYTAQKASFLKSTIDKNEEYANQLLDSNLIKIKSDALLNSKLFTSNYEAEKISGVWHYKSILYTYQLDIENGTKYYDKLKESGNFPLNNYATFCAIQGKFAEAKNFYNEAKLLEQGDKRLKESFYYLSILNQYSNNNQQSIEELKSLIKQNGSTPGFGWYNIALSRNYLYDGQLDEAKKFATKAAQFKEIHIGTTLGQSHYDFSVMLMNLILKKREIEALSFHHRRWWLSPNDIFKKAKLTFEKYGLQFLIINQFATNPERDRVIYKLFSTESTVSFDEIFELIDGFSSNFFLNRFKAEISNDKRFEVKRYYKLFVAKLLIKQKKYDEAKGYLQSIENEILLDHTQEKLLLARTFEALAICEMHENNGLMVQDYLQKMYAIYPQLIPYSGQQLIMNLQTNASTSDEIEIINNLKKSRIEFSNSLENGLPQVNIKFIKKGELNTIEVSVSQYGKAMIKKQQISYTKKDDIVKRLSLLLFGIGLSSANNGSN
jgi:hypothetical protein